MGHSYSQEGLPLGPAVIRQKEVYAVLFGICLIVCGMHAMTVACPMVEGWHLFAFQIGCFEDWGKVLVGMEILAGIAHSLKYSGAWSVLWTA
jgi:hypothetical protein